MAWYMVWPGGHGMGKGMAWRAWHSIWYGLAMVYGIDWLLSQSRVQNIQMVWPGGHGMVYDMAWRA